MAGVIYHRSGTRMLGTASSLGCIEPNSPQRITYIFTATNYFDRDCDVNRIDGKFSFAADRDFERSGELEIHEFIDFQFNFGDRTFTQVNADSFAISFITDKDSGINVPALQGIGRWGRLLFSFSKLRVDLPILSIGTGSLKNRHPFGFPDYARIKSPPRPAIAQGRGEVA